MNDTCGTKAAANKTWKPMNERRKAKSKPNGEYKIRGISRHPVGNLRTKKNALVIIERKALRQEEDHD